MFAGRFKGVIVFVGSGRLDLSSYFFVQKGGCVVLLLRNCSRERTSTDGGIGKDGFDLRGCDSKRSRWDER